MHIQEIEENLEKIHQAGLKIVAVSMDDQDLAATFAKEVAANMGKESLDVPILYNLTEEQASRDWGLFLSNKRPGTNEPELYSEPGLFVIRPDNTVFFVQRQSAPFTRPSMEQLVFGLTYAAENKYPTRGTVVTEAVAAKVVAERASLENPGAPTTQ
jgi:peroxiredoxin